MRPFSEIKVPSSNQRIAGTIPLSFCLFLSLSVSFCLFLGVAISPIHCPWFDSKISLGSFGPMPNQLAVGFIPRFSETLSILLLLLLSEMAEFDTINTETHAHIYTSISIMIYNMCVGFFRTFSSWISFWLTCVSRWRITSSY